MAEDKQAPQLSEARAEAAVQDGGAEAEQGPASFFEHIGRTYLRPEAVILAARNGPGMPGEIDLDRTTLETAIRRRELSRIDLVRLDLHSADTALIGPFRQTLARFDALGFVTFDAIPGSGTAGPLAIARVLLATFTGLYGFREGAVSRLERESEVAACRDGVLCVGGDGGLRPVIAPATVGEGATRATAESDGPGARADAEAAAVPAAGLRADYRMAEPLRHEPADVPPPLLREAEPLPEGRPAGGLLRDLFWAVIAIAAAVAAEGVSLLRWRQPLSLEGDHLRFMAQARALMEGQGFRSNPFLAAPLSGGGSDLDTYALLPKTLLLLLAQSGLSVFALVKLFYVVLIGATALAAYLALRALSVRPWVAAACAVVFTVSPWFATGALARPFDALPLAVPLGGLLAFQMAGMVAPAPRRAGANIRGLIAWLGVLVAGTCGLAYAALAGLFVAAAGLAATLGRQRLLTPVLTLATLAALFGLVLVSAHLPAEPALASGLTLPASGYDPVQEGLSLSDALFTIPRLGRFGDDIATFAASSLPLFSEARVLWPGFVLGWVILLAPLLLLARLSAPSGSLSLGHEPSGRRKDARGPGTLAAALIVLGVVLAVRGGAGFAFPERLAAAIGSPDRFLPYLAFFAAVVVGRAAEWCLRARWILLRPVGFLIPLAALAAALPSAGTLLVEPRRTPGGAADRNATGDGLEPLLVAKSQAGLKTILQLPILPLGPVPAPLVRLPGDADSQSAAALRQLLPFILDRARPPSRWSSGAEADQPGFREFRATIHEGSVDPGGLAARAQAAGFDALLVDKSAYGADELLALQNGLAAGVRAGCHIHDDPVWSLWRLSGQDQGLPCLAVPPPQPGAVAIDFRSAGGAAFLGEGWTPPVPGGGGATAQGPQSTLLLPKPAGTGDVTATLTLAVAGSPLSIPRTIAVTLDRNPLDATLALAGSGGALTIQLPRLLMGSGPLLRLGLAGAAPSEQVPTVLSAIRLDAPPPPR